MSDFEDDDFGDFGEASRSSQVPSVGPQVSVHDLSEGKLDSIRHVLDELLEVDTSVAAEPELSNEEPQETETSELLWKHLTEQPSAFMPDWNSSQTHKLLAVKLGVPLNLDLDRTLKRRAQRNLELPSELLAAEGMQDMPRWRLLSEVSTEAVDGMSLEELRQHAGLLRTASEQAEALRSKLEDQEIDLLGEQNVLEGMVESLLVYSQRTHRESMMRRS